MTKSLLSVLLSMTLLISMLAAVLVAPLSASAEEEIAVGTGDYNGDGTVNLVDLINFNRYLCGEIVLTDAKEATMDVVADGVADVHDASRLYAYVNGTCDTVGGVAQALEDVYVTFDLQTAEVESMLAAGETVTLELTASQAADLAGVQLQLGYDASKLAFVSGASTLSSLSFSFNSEPVEPYTDGGELWIAGVSSKGTAVSDGDVVATLTFEALVNITADTAVSVLGCKAVSEKAVKELCTVSACGRSGGVAIQEPTDSPTDPDTYVTYTIETVEHEGPLAAGENIELSVFVSEVADLNGLSLYLALDKTQWTWVDGTFVGQVSDFSYTSVNTAPAAPLTEQTEIWLTAMDMGAHSFAQGEAVATVTLKALCDITSDAVIGACYSQASSRQGTIDGYVPSSAWVDGGVRITEVLFTGPSGDYFYVDNVPLTAYQLVEHNGDHYFVGEGDKLAKDTTVYLDAALVADHVYSDGTAMVEGYYRFDADGKMVTLNGFVEINGTLRYYIDGKPQRGLALIEIDGDYYYVRTSGVVVTNGEWYVDKTNAYGFPAGVYEFGADGKMVILNGIVEVDGVLRYYIDGIPQSGLALIEWEGDYYYVRSTGVVVTNDVWYVDKTNAYGFPAGVYEFGADGKMVILNGIVEVDGVLRYYINGVPQSGLSLIEWEGDYYYVRSTGVVVTNGEWYVDKTNAYGFPAGVYEFGADGKMVVLNGIVEVDGVLRYYINGIPQSGLALIEWEEDYYYVRSTGVVVTNDVWYVDKTNAYGFPAGVYEFGADGKMVILNGIVEVDGVLRYYINGIPQSGLALIEWEGDYYYVRSTGVVVTNGVWYVDKTNAYGFPAGVYEFGADGKMVLE